MTPTEALAYIHGTARFGSKPGLRRVENLLLSMGDPHRRLRYVHVAGTKGKGSTCAMTAAILREAGYTVGLYTSPYLLSFYERIQVNGQSIAPQELADRVAHIRAVIDGIVAETPELQPTEFEIITALAFQYFLDRRCDYVVLEVGLGGRFDATNVIPAPAAAAITAMGFDHMEYLGDTIEQITAEKCGILKPGTGAVVTCLEQDPDALRVIRDACEANALALSVPDPELLTVRREDLDGSEFSYGGLDISLPLAGDVQIQNALSAVLLAAALGVPDAAIQAGLRRTCWHGRLEVVRRTPLCVVDGAHNGISIRRLCHAMDTLLTGRRLVVIMGMLADKDYEPLIGLVASRAAVFIACSPDSPRALTAEQIARCAQGLAGRVLTARSPAEAVKLALAEAGDGDCVLATGSLYLIGAISQAF